MSSHDREIKLQDDMAQPHSNEPRRMLTEAQVLDLVPFGRTTLFSLIKAGGFPRGTYVSPNRRAWFADEIAHWQNALSQGNPHFNPNRRRGASPEQRSYLTTKRPDPHKAKSDR